MSDKTPEPHACVIAPVLPHGLEGASTRIERGLGHAGLRERLRVDVADESRRALAHQPRRELVQEVLPAVGDLGVNRLDAVLVPRALGHGQRRLQVTVELLGLDFDPVRAGQRLLEAKAQIPRSRLTA